VDRFYDDDDDDDNDDDDDDDTKNVTLIMSSEPLSVELHSRLLLLASLDMLNQ